VHEHSPHEACATMLRGDGRGAHGSAERRTSKPSSDHREERSAARRTAHGAEGADALTKRTSSEAQAKHGVRHGALDGIVLSRRSFCSVADVAAVRALFTAVHTRQQTHCCDSLDERSSSQRSRHTRTPRTLAPLSGRRRIHRATNVHVGTPRTTTAACFRCPAAASAPC
jgi:hypothetical protein